MAAAKFAVTFFRLQVEKAGVQLGLGLLHTRCIDSEVTHGY